MSSADALTKLVSDGRTELREGYAEVGEVRLHYVEVGDGPLVVLLHGFPEFWWRTSSMPRTSRSRSPSACSRTSCTRLLTEELRAAFRSLR
jgi:pimeloyl-ACP methyl ester carboxylesterase